MGLRETARDYFLEGYNWGESVIRAVCPDCEHDAVKAVAAFAGGMASGRTCGAVSAAVGCLGILTIEDCQKNAPDSRPLIKEFLDIYESKYKEFNCKDLKPVVAKKDIRCADFVGDVAELLGEFIKEKIK